MSERFAEHEARNHARMLTPAEKRAKEKAKMQNSATDYNLEVAIFRVKNLDGEEGKHKFKIDTQQNSLSLTGCVLQLSDSSPGAQDGVNIVVVEGGPKGIQKFCRLMLRRIKWNTVIEEDKDDDSEEDSEEEENEEDKAKRLANLNGCLLVWKGYTARREFSSFTFQVFDDPGKCRAYVQARGVPQYWDIAARFMDDGAQNPQNLERIVGKGFKAKETG